MKKIFLWLGFIIGFLFWLWGINDPYVGSYSANNNYLSLASKNFLRFGYITLHFFPTYFAGLHLPSHPDYYLHHPVLFFLFASIPYIFFGPQNWVVHVATGFFLLGAIFMVFKIGQLVWNKKIGLYAALFAVIFPATGFFWKFIFFEQSTLFFLLLVVYFFIKYLKKGKRKDLLFIGLFSLFAILCDWGAGYFVFSIPLFFLVSKKKTVNAYVIYLLMLLIGVLIFISSVLLLKGNFTDFIRAVSTRSVDNELFGLSFWYVRLPFLTIVRIIIYFTPLSFLPIFYFSKVIKEKKLIKLENMLLLFFLIFGLVNIIFLPTASWGHSYFVFYFIPFFAYVAAIYFSKIKKEYVVTLLIIFLLCWSGVIQYLKLYQVRKQEWKYNAAKNASVYFSPYQTIGVVDFPGDIFENYFYHSTKALTQEDIFHWGENKKYQSLTTVVYACWDVCTDTSYIDWLKEYFTVQTVGENNKKLWLLRKKPENAVLPYIQKQPPYPLTQKSSTILEIYRSLRDFFSVGQI